MDIKYSFPGSMTIIMNENDKKDLAMYGHLSEREGLIGTDSKTWVRLVNPDEGEFASIDGDGDVNIYVARTSTPPTVFESRDVRPGNRAPDDIALHFLGATGTITLDVNLP